jgi:predicted ATPase with chaperone activity
MARNKKEKTNLSYRQITKLTKVSRTIADLEQSSEIEISHLDEAWSLRCPDLFSL